MTLVQALKPEPAGDILSTSEFNSYAPNDGEIVSVLATGNWAGGDSVWTLRNRLVNPDGTANSNNLHWDFIGGSAIWDAISAQDSAGFTGAWIDLLGGAHLGTPQVPSFPFHGLFEVHFGSQINASVDGVDTEVGISVNGANPVASATAVHYSTRWSSVSRVSHMNLGIGDNVKMMYFATSGTTLFQQRFMSILPIRISSG